MKYTKIEENNILIAKFMGITVRRRFLWYGIYNIDGELLTTSWTENSGWKLVGQLTKFNSSWDWLMPVIEKIYNLPGDNKPYYGVTFIMHNDTFRFSLDNINREYLTPHSPNKRKIERIVYMHEAVVEFIKWYNGQNEEIPL